jgi:hypothetical protein
MNDSVSSVLVIHGDYDTFLNMLRFLHKVTVKDLDALDGYILADKMLYLEFKEYCGEFLCNAVVAENIQNIAFYLSDSSVTVLGPGNFDFLRILKKSRNCPKNQTEMS